MTCLRAIAFTVVSCVAIASAHAGDAQKILALEEQRNQVILHGDVATLDRLTSDDYTGRRLPCRQS
jgi:hypothetical protein